MSYSNQKMGIYTHQEAFDGINLGDIPGPSGILTNITIFWSAEDLPVLGPDYSVIGYPAGPAGNGAGPDVAVNRTYLPDASDDTLWTPGPIDTGPYNGIFGVPIRMEVSTNEGIRRLTVQFTALDSTDPTDFPGAPAPDVPKSASGVSGEAPTIEPNPPASDGIVVITFQSGEADPADEDGFVIERSKVGGVYPWDIAGNVPSDPAIHPNYQFTDNIAENGFDIGEGTYTYRIRSYKLDAPGGPSLSDPTDETPPVIYGSSENELVIVGDLTLDMDWQSTMVFITNPSGIYTPVSGQKFDRLYNRGGDPYVDVAIPEPFVKIGPFK